MISRNPQPFFVDIANENCAWQCSYDLPWLQVARTIWKKRERNVKRWHESHKLWLQYRSSHIPAAKNQFQFNAPATDWISSHPSYIFITSTKCAGPSASCEYIKCHHGHYVELENVDLRLPALYAVYWLRSMFSLCVCQPSGKAWPVRAYIEFSPFIKNLKPTPVILTWMHA